MTPDPLDPNIIYGAGRTTVSRYDWRTGQTQNVTPIPLKGSYRAERTEPLVFSPVDRRTLYYATNVLWKTVDHGRHWVVISPDLANPKPGIPPSVGDQAAKDKSAGTKRGAIYAVAPSFKTVNTIWAGTDDGKIWITRDGGTRWKDVTPPNLPGWSKVTQLEASHYSDSTAYASVSGFRIDDPKPYIYRTRDGGRSWQLIVGGLDDSPVNTMREDPVRRGLLFAGTENGVWVSFNDGEQWQPLQLNLPHTSMRDLWIHDTDLIVATHGRSLWILDDIAPLRQATGNGAKSDLLFTPSTAIRVRQTTWSETPLPPEEPVGKNPPNGAVIDYYLARPAEGVVRLDILDAQGKVVRAYASDDPPDRTPEQLRTQMIPPYWVRPSRNPDTTIGMHRFVWDLHYTAPKSVTREYPITAVPHDTPRSPLGPWAVPGTYTVRLTTGGRSYTAPLRVKLDPRVTTTPAALEQMFALQVRLAGLVDRSSAAVFEAVSLQEQSEKLATTGAVADSLKAFTARIEAALEGEASGTAAEKLSGLRDVNGEAYALYGMVGQADAAPTAAQVAAAAKIAHEAAPALEAWETLMRSDLPAVNARLRGAGLAVLDPGQAPEHGENQGNEE